MRKNIISGLRDFGGELQVGGVFSYLDVMTNIPLSGYTTLLRHTQRQKSKIMIHQTVITKKMLIPGDEKSIIGVPSTIPTILKKNSDGSIDVVTDGPLFVDDEIISWPQPKLTVDKIIETRKAKGDWSGETWKGLKPTWSKIKTK